jgi:hypothetical protein
VGDKLRGSSSPSPPISSSTLLGSRWGAGELQGVTKLAVSGTLLLPPLMLRSRAYPAGDTAAAGAAGG